MSLKIDSGTTLKRLALDRAQSAPYDVRNIDAYASKIRHVTDRSKFTNPQFYAHPDRLDVRIVGQSLARVAPQVAASLGSGGRGVGVGEFADGIDPPSLRDL
jgi:hypothetical protein